MNRWQKGLEGVNNQEGMHHGSSNMMSTMEKMQAQIAALDTVQHTHETPAPSNESLDIAQEPTPTSSTITKHSTTTHSMLGDSLSQNQDLP